MSKLRPSQAVLGWFGIILLLLLWLAILARGRLPYALLEQFRLHLSQKGYGWQGSWQSADLPILSLPIDQAVYTTPLLVLDRGVGPMVGSDHRPIHVTFTFAPP